mmetsp:Transcript_28014/g.52560  ORF Transcript_28014/g.52560 Transcript_28014/m.52560 type:complete len:418 (-) Transcript_28014:628-1881(-)
MRLLKRSRPCNGISTAPVRDEYPGKIFRVSGRPLLWTVLFWLHSIIRTLGLEPLVVYHNFFNNNGVTSLHCWNDASLLAVGTKKAGIYYQHRPTLVASKVDTRCIFGDDNNTGNNWKRLDYETKFPTYSLASSNAEQKTLYCGGGNRFVSVWKDKNGPLQMPKFECVQELGPHTGWVKDLVLDAQNHILHSIGCNCIESWDCSSAPMQHLAKRSIENSPVLGSTLSSDLLCLCLVERPSGSNGSLLVSGGVDGRIHVWSSHLGQGNHQPLCAVAAHDGRVNTIVHSSSLNAILTVGNDGVLCVFRISTSLSSPSIELLANFNLKPGSAELRMTAAVVIDPPAKDGECRLALGSSDGAVSFFTVSIVPEEDVLLSKDSASLFLEGNPTIYAMAHERKQNTSQLWIGHATGLSSIDLAS